MEEITISDRLISVLTKWTEVFLTKENYDQYKLDESHYLSHDSDEECDFIPTVHYGKLGNFNWNNGQWIMTLKYINTDIFNITPDMTQTNYLEKIQMEILDFKGKIYQFCLCNNIVYKNGKCKNCYIYSEIREENCSICLENDYQWVMFDCKHVIHHHCFLQLKNKKCPLCRKKITNFNLI